ncbi:NUDIX domain-containing protein [Candidatus Bathyarchaeota archaeon]|nr:NUDIX domain-containing protein [Candidatus Bathyarchaeota archaeon]
MLFRKINGRTRYLLLKRTPDRGGFWQPVTGGLETGETRVKAVEREVRQETGIKNFVGMIEDVHYFECSLPQQIKEYVFGVEVHPDEKMVREVG